MQQYTAQATQPQQPRPVAGPVGLTSAAQFWYVLQGIAMGAGYFAKIPAKKALSDFGMAEMTGAEKFWYVLMCIGFGAGYFDAAEATKKPSDEGRCHCRPVSRFPIQQGR